MNPRWSHLILAAAGMGAITGGSVAALISREDSPESGTPAAVAPVNERSSTPANATASDDVAARLTQLERRVATLQVLQQRLALDRQVKNAERGPAGDTPTADPNALDVADPVFEAAVADIIERDIERRRVERREQRQQQREQEMARTVSQLSRTLSLAPAQQSELLRLLNEHQGKVSELRENSDPNVDNRADLRARFDALAATTEESVLRVLSPQQVDSYRALPRDEQINLGRRNTRSRPATGTQPGRE
jgi:hypothetical protein